MFFRLYKYSLLCSARERLFIFWNLIFPIILGSLFQIAFGSYTEKEVLFHKIPVAYVEEEGADENFAQLLKTLETDNDLVQVQTVEKDEAEQLLREEKVEGIFYNEAVKQTETEISLVVQEQDINQSILSSILEQYERTYATLLTIGKEYPQGIQAAAALVEEEIEYLEESSIGAASNNDMLNYFYSLIAMNCLMGTTTGLACAMKFKANLSALAARRVIAGVSRFRVLWPDLAANISLQFLYVVFSVCYLMFVLHVPIGDQWGFLLLTIFVGTLLGIFLGFFVGVAVRLPYNAKEALCILIMMVSCFFSGLMADGMQRLIDRYVPVFSHINPSSLIVKSFYSLNIYDTYGRYLENMGTMAILILILAVGSFVVVRRERYASI
ncbi:hypothetical protein C806_03830 [Lachnospiraceae bacterium 3-1]|nr:hypothetical protein C806_03830 [Lachnospiraceae bacterium 3-1]